MKKGLLIVLAGFLLLTGCSSKQSKLIYVPANSENIDINRSDSLYEITRKEELARMIQEPIIPMKTQDKILRVLVLPYVDKNNLLQTSSFMFVQVDEGKWIIGDYLDRKRKSMPSLLTPLK